MRRIYLIVLCLLILFSCVHLGTAKEPENNYKPVARIGVTTEDREKGLTVIAIQKDSPSEQAGIKRGDIIVSINGTAISSRRALIKCLNDKDPGETVSLIVNRDGQGLTFYIKLMLAKFRPSLVKTTDLLLDGKKVTLAVIVSSVTDNSGNMPPNSTDSVKAWAQSQCESVFLAAFGNYDNFAVVDCSRLKLILDEFQFSQLGFVSDKLRVKIGEMTGATHIIDISISRYKSSDETSARLIEIESGKVLAVDVDRKYH